MKVRIRGVEIYVENMEELDGLIERYGSEVSADSLASAEPQTSRKKVAGVDTRDRVVLQRFVEAGSVGVPTTEIGKLLGKRGRGTRRAVRQWAVRIGLVDSESVDPFEECRVGNQRGMRIEAAHIGVAKALA